MEFYFTYSANSNRTFYKMAAFNLGWKHTHLFNETFFENKYSYNTIEWALANQVLKLSVLILNLSKYVLAVILVDEESSRKTILFDWRKPINDMTEKQTGIFT